MTDNTLPNQETRTTEAVDSGMRLSAGNIALLVGVLTFVVVVGLQLMQQNSIGATPGGGAPMFTVTTFDGEELSLAALEGNVVVLNFWASWCIPCRDEAPELQDLWARYEGEAFMMVGLTHGDIQRDSLAFMEEFAITYPNAPDLGSRIYEAYGLTGVPETYIIAPDGTVALHIPGPLSESTMPRFETTIIELLGAL